MTNRDLILMKLIQLSPEQFAEMLNDQITELMHGALCELCMKRNGGQCAAEQDTISGCNFDLAAWLKEDISREKLEAAATVS